VRRERHFVRKILSNTFQPSNEFCGLFFDGKEDKARVIENKKGVNYPVIEIEDHYAIVSEPESKYLGHVTVENGQSLMIATNIVQILEAQDLQKDKINAIGANGIVVNTGVHRSVIQSIEEKLNKPLQWLICLLHMNELSLRHLLMTALQMAQNFYCCWEPKVVSS
jgi:hypothetical protein